VLGDLGEEPVGLLRLALQVLQDAVLAVGDDVIDEDLARLAEPPEAPDALVILLEAVPRERGHVGAVLPVEAPRADDRLRDEDAGLAASRRR
jgi:hypothetical protein